jgi:quinol-cytochrome oxidoreductase complex cytochrome b subunit
MTFGAKFFVLHYRIFVEIKLLLVIFFHFFAVKKGETMGGLEAYRESGGKDDIE